MEVGRELQRKGCEVSYFGQYDPRNVVGNRIGISAPQKIRNPFALIYSKDVYRKFSALLEAEKPDLIHLNNINFQLTPAVIDASKKYRIPVVWTMHDPQLICPCHRLYIGHMHKICTQCIDGKVGNCVKNRCFKGSFLQSYCCFH